MFKTIHNFTPSYLCELFDLRSTGYNFRNSENALFVPKPRTNYGCKRNFSHDGVKLWNLLLQNVRAICSLTQFKRQIRKFFSI